MKRKRITRKSKAASIERYDDINNFKFVRHYPHLHKRDNKNPK